MDKNLFLGFEIITEPVGDCCVDGDTTSRYFAVSPPSYEQLVQICRWELYGTLTED